MKEAWEEDKKSSSFSEIHKNFANLVLDLSDCYQQSDDHRKEFRLLASKISIETSTVR